MLLDWLNACLVRAAPTKISEGQVAKALKRALKEANRVCEHDRPLLSEIMDFFESQRDNLISHLAPETFVGAARTRHAFSQSSSMSCRTAYYVVVHNCKQSPAKAGKLVMKWRAKLQAYKLIAVIATSDVSLSNLYS